MACSDGYPHAEVRTYVHTPNTMFMSIPIVIPICMRRLQQELYQQNIYQQGSYPRKYRPFDDLVV